MSRQALESILGRCTMDDDLSTQVFADPDHALANYELMKEDRPSLLAVDAETLDAFAEYVGVQMTTPAKRKLHSNRWS